MYIPVPTFVREKSKPVELEHTIATNEEDNIVIAEESVDVAATVEQTPENPPTDPDNLIPEQTPVTTATTAAAPVPSQEKHVIISNDDEHVTSSATTSESKVFSNRSVSYIIISVFILETTKY